MNIEIDNIFLHCVPEGTEFDTIVYDDILTRLTRLLYPNYIHVSTVAPYKRTFTTEKINIYKPHESVGKLFQHVYEISINNFYPALMISQGDNIYTHPIASIVKTLLEYRVELKTRVWSQNINTGEYLTFVSKKFINFTYGMCSNLNSILACTIPHTSIGDITINNANVCLERMREELELNNYTVIYMDTDRLYVEDCSSDKFTESRKTELNTLVSGCIELYRYMSFKVATYDYVMVIGMKNVLRINGVLTHMHLKNTRYI